MAVDTELQTKVIAIVADVLGYESDEITVEQNFFHDLGGESIDMIDLQFRVEKELGIRAAFQHMMSGSRWDLDGDGRFTSETRAHLGEEFPFLNPGLEAGRLQMPYDLMTIHLIAEFVELAGRRTKVDAV
jgi:acyl carrier protein